MDAATPGGVAHVQLIARPRIPPPRSRPRQGAREPAVGFPFDGEAFSLADRLLAIADRALRSDERVLVGCIRADDDGVVEREERASAQSKTSSPSLLLRSTALAAGPACPPGCRSVLNRAAVVPGRWRQKGALSDRGKTNMVLLR